MEENQSDYVVYMLRCADGTLYTGITNNLEKRLQAHEQGKASKCTRARLPVQLVYLERGFTKGEALSRERAVKKMSRSEKLRMIGGQAMGEGAKRLEMPVRPTEAGHG